MKEKGLFIMGTDTDVGKTFITALIGGLLKEEGHAVGMVKPVASGALRAESGELYSSDATEHMRLVGIDEALKEEVNPLCLEGEFSPKVAAELQGIEIPLEQLKAHVHKVVKKYDYTLIEGAGGITTPMTANYSFADFAKDLNYKALLVADGRLGSINRVLLTVAYAKQLGIEVLGIIVNDQDKTDAFLLKSNAEEMALYTGLPVLGVVPPYEGPKVREEEIAFFRKYFKLEAFLTAWEA